MTLTVTQLKDHVSTTLGDEALDRLLGAAYSAIDVEIGLAGDVQEYFRPHGKLLMLSRRAESITEIIEGGTTLAADDYKLRASGHTLRRLTRHHWHGLVDVTYTPYDDTDRRDLAAIELVKLEIAFNPTLASQQIGQWTETYLQGQPYAAQRKDILSSLTESADGGIW